ncbi:class I SAM-dependent RNA methyltransferase [Aliiroseovarius sp. KMU-50]|uniref:Class I SAM-dependent RNA methyltransferase n=1 Tax=Aliiroseovarius salicola TaxID=3009082 RepID=A0ABT4VXF9_9RHOB|nr:class I SAM-dependent RNA methyltransferase [Aliiroseovarius sp. KMU-50]MDA5092956.1 class I SAM-dependent RNA methyltransferase [Aliiroseovarius sp. KMU-50]
MSDTTYTIERLGHHGDGIAPGPIFVQRALPGEDVSGDVVDGRIEAPRIVTPSANRIKAPCPHYNSCGGCALLHASDDFVAGWKTDVIRNALSAHGLETDIRPIATSPVRSRRRATLSARRGKKGAIIGFHGRRSGTITSIEHCHLLAPELLKQLPAVEALTFAGGSRKGELSVNLALSEGGVDVSVRNGKSLDRALETDLAQVLHQFGLARLAWNGEVIASETPPFQQFGKAKVTPPSGAFLQATREGELSLVNAVREGVGQAETIVDLFSGVGTLSLPLADQAQIHAVEGIEDMMRALDEGWRRSSGLKQVTTETRDLFRRPLLPDELNRFDAIVIDPPRAGAQAQVEEISGCDVPRVAMVSCNPVSFARDAQVLVSSGYRLNWVLPVDQFRWSPHVELAASFSKA